jgi:hypothetical protein
VAGKADSVAGVVGGVMGHTHIRQSDHKYGTCANEQANCTCNQALGNCNLSCQSFRGHVTLRETGFYFFLVLGRSPDLRVDGLKAPSQFPSGINFKTSPLTVAGAVTVLAPFGSSSPYSLLGSLAIAFEHRALCFWQYVA